MSFRRWGACIARMRMVMSAELPVATKSSRSRLITLSCVVLSIATCNKSTETPPSEEKPKLGDACETEGKIFCTGKNDSIVCVDKRFEALPCREGCSKLEARPCEGCDSLPPPKAVCTNARHLEGEYCPPAYHDD